MKKIVELNEPAVLRPSRVVEEMVEDNWMFSLTEDTVSIEDTIALTVQEVVDNSKKT